ncbi:MAG: nuclear transport factor 2 family protein [Acidobacteriota bacterium]|nr:nuclear transport factor 2 family protein [Acidobacteriota bacterium]
MRKVVFALAIVLVAALAAASDKSDAVAAVHQFADGFNQGDVASALATCASPASIVDEFPPYAWQGPKACADWAHDYDADAKKNGITDGKVTLGKPWHVDVSGDRAYVVMPAKYSFKQKGKRATEPASILTVALQKGTAGWRITGWAWSKR